MKQEVRTTTTIDPKIMESLVIRGDLGGLTPNQKVEYYAYRCSQVGLDPSAKPFDIMTFQGRQVLYANKGCTEQLIAKHGLSTQIVARERMDDIYCVHCRVTGSDGRYSENMGAVPLKGLMGDAMANALLKATTKAVRRTVLAHCGLGMLDETEVETIPGAVVERVPMVEYTRPGDAEPVVEVVAPDEWTEEEREEAKLLLMDFGQTVMEAGWEIDAPKIQATLKKFRQEIGDGTFSNWANRLNLAGERAVKAAPKPLTVTAGDESPLPKQNDLPKSSDSVAEVVSDPEQMSIEQLKSLRADLWVKLWKKWDTDTADGRSLQERHRVNRTQKRKEEWTAGLVKDSPEYLLSEIDGLQKELAQ